MRLIFCLSLLGMLTTTANAEVIKSATDGFIVQHSVVIDHDSARVFQVMTSQVGDWWDPAHSFSNNADNMLIDQDCFCERWNGNLVRHLDTTIWLENSKVVMQGGLGPLKELGLSGVMVWSLAPNRGSGTVVSWKYHVFGFSEAGLAGLATAVDGVLNEQIERLAGNLKD